MAEKWKAVPGYEGRYEVSSRGRVRSLKRKRVPETRVLKPHVDKDGYEELSACKDGDVKYLKIHRLVYECFVGPIPEGHFINHRDNCKFNNHIRNLETVTNQGNLDHAMKWRRKTGYKYRKLSNDEVAAIKWELTLGNCGRRIAEKWGVRPSRIYDIQNGKTFKNVN